MSDTMVLNATVRADIGKGASRRLRRVQNLIPGIIYGANKAPSPVSLDHNKVIKFLENEAVYASILNLNVDGTSEKVVLKALQRHPYKPKVLHMDFMRIDANAKLHIKVPLHFINAESAPGVLAGGVVSHLFTEVEVICLPKDLCEFLSVDIGALELDHSLHLSDIILPKGVELAAFSHGEDNQDTAIVNIYEPRAVIEEVAAPTEEEEAADEDDKKESNAPDDKSS